MDFKDIRYKTYVDILHEELIPAMGCTEPIAIAYAAAKAREVLGKLPDRVFVEVSGNVIKNVKSVVVPHTGGLRGIPAATAAGIIAGNASKELEVLSEVTHDDITLISKFLESVPITVKCADTPYIFDNRRNLYRAFRNQWRGRFVPPRGFSGAEFQSVEGISLRNSQILPMPIGINRLFSYYFYLL